MERIKDTVERVIQGLGDKRSRAGRQDPDALLKKVLTKKEVSHIKCNYFKGGVLGIGVDSSAWLYEMNLKKNSILSRLQKISPSVKNIRLYLGDVG